MSCSGITAFSAVKKALPLAANEPIVVIGAGGLGLTAISLLHAMGHRKIFAVDVVDDKLQAARAVGASAIVLARKDADVTADIVNACGAQPRAIVDFVNGAQTAAFAFNALRKGGKLIQVGLMAGSLRCPYP